MTILTVVFSLSYFASFLQEQETELLNEAQHTRGLVPTPPMAYWKVHHCALNPSFSYPNTVSSSPIITESPHPDSEVCSLIFWADGSFENLPNCAHALIISTQTHFYGAFIEASWFAD